MLPSRIYNLAEMWGHDSFFEGCSLYHSSMVTKIDEEQLPYVHHTPEQCKNPRDFPVLVLLISRYVSKQNQYTLNKQTKIVTL